LTIGTAFPSAVEMKKVKYMRNVFPPRTVLPPIVNELAGGRILDLPDKEIKKYLQSKIDLQ
jgi:hypothetical protein